MDRNIKLQQLQELIEKHPEALASLTPEQQEKIRAVIATKDEPQRRRYPAKLVNRCECGRQISNHRFRCLACQIAFLEDVGSQIENQEMLDAVIQQYGHGPEFLSQIKPYLKFEPATPATV